MSSVVKIKKEPLTSDNIVKKNRKHTSRKKRKQTRLRLPAWFITILFVIPILYGLYLCLPQIRQTFAPEFSRTEVSPVPATSYDDLEIARLTAATGRPQQIIRHKGYTVSYNYAWRQPNWVGYELTRQEARGIEKRNDRFVPDPLAKRGTATNADYARSGYDKGHMAPAADMKWSATAMKESFYFSNISPQHPELNRRKWKDLEGKVREWSLKDSAVIIVCGPIMEPRTARSIGRNRVAVPERFFKVILSPYTHSPRAIGFIFPNSRATAPLRTYAVTVDSVERAARMDFFSALPDSLEDKIEAECKPKAWGL